MPKRRNRNSRKHQSTTCAGMKVSANRVSSRKMEAEIRKIEAETDIIYKRYRLDVYKIWIASGGFLATVLSILKAVFGT
ncbi:MAG: hypothetical protein V3U84_08040 [Thiotrichaceae bacterium]